MRTKLITALRAAADEVEKNPDGYDWTESHRCNCGIVAKHLSGMDEVKFNEAACGVGLWTAAVRRCKKTGLKIPDVMHGLFAAGMNVEEVNNLEYLMDVNVLTALGVSSMYGAHPDYDKPHGFISYARKWADMMEQGVLP